MSDTLKLLADELLGPSEVLWPTISKGGDSSKRLLNPLVLGNSARLSIKQGVKTAESLLPPMGALRNAVQDLETLKSRKLFNECVKYILTEPLPEIMSHAIVFGYPSLVDLQGIKDRLERLLADADVQVRIDYKRVGRVARRLNKALLATEYELEDFLFQAKLFSEGAF